jgi:hypothetical protein
LKHHDTPQQKEERDNPNDALLLKREHDSAAKKPSQLQQQINLKAFFVSSMTESFDFFTM